VTDADFRGLRRLARAAGDAFVAGVILYDGEVSAPLGEHIHWRSPPPLQAVARSGAEDLYSSWVTQRYGMIPPQDVVTAFRGLVDWVRTGARPTWPTTP
jgi:hypothetical protein